MEDWEDKVGRLWRVVRAGHGFQLTCDDKTAAWSDGRSIQTFEGSVGITNLFRLLAVAREDLE